MTTEKILSTLTIDRSSPKSLKSQLEEQLEALLVRLEPETALPPERMISETLEISRVTVRSALEKFYRNGMIVRRGRLGTMVAPRKQEFSQQINPFILGMEYEMMQPAPLRFLIYENLPKQKMFWEKVVAEYNETHKNTPVEMVWLSPGTAPDQISEIIKKEAVDVIMMSDFFRFDEQQELAKLPPTLKKLLTSDQYIYKNMGFDSDYQIPFYISVPTILWNQEMAEELGIKNIPERMNRGELLPLLKEAAEKLPEDCSSGIRIWDYFHFKALPDMLTGNMDGFRSVLEGIAQIGKSAADKEKLFVLSQNHTLDNLESFLQGKRLFLLANISHLHIYDSPKFRHGYLLFPQKAKLLTDTLRFSITKNCLDIQSAAEFIQFLLSKNAQELCAEFKENLPVNKPVLLEHLQKKYHLTEKATSDIIQSLFLRKSYDNRKNIVSDLLGIYLRTELKDLLSGTLTIDDFMKIMDDKYDSLKYRARVRIKNAI